MATLETPPNPATPPPAENIRAGRYADLDPHELIYLLDEVNDERARARFREAIYISVIVWLAIGWFIFYGPQVIFHQPRLVNPADVLKQRDRELTYLDLPKDITKQLPRKPTNTLSDKDRTQQTTRPSLDRKTLDQLQAMRKAGSPGAATPLPKAPQPQPSATQLPPPEPATQQQAQQQRPPVVETPRPQPQQQAMADAPRPAPTRPNFSQPAQTAGDAIRQAARQAAEPGQGGNFGAGIPVEHQGMNTGVDVLSDTMGVDFNPYLRRILREIYTTWLPLIPEEARPPLNKQGTTLIRFSILPDGHIGTMTLDGSSHDDALNRAAWGSITGVGQFPPLPKEFHGPNLELRIHYLVNKDPSAQ
jgi:TonB family protein